MNNQAAALGLLALLSLSPLSQAENPVRFPEGNRAWTVDIRYAQSGAEDAPEGNTPPRPVRLDCSSYEGLERYLITWSNRTSSEVWKQQGITLAKDPKTGRIGLANNAIIPSLVGAPDAELFTWIGQAGAGAEVVFEKRKALRYTKAALNGSPDPFGNSEDRKNRQAWIELESQRPLAYDNGLATFLFTFSPTPSQPLSMPADFAKLHERILSTTSQQPTWKK